MTISTDFPFQIVCCENDNFSLRVKEVKKQNGTMFLLRCGVWRTAAVSHQGTAKFCWTAPLILYCLHLMWSMQANHVSLSLRYVFHSDGILQDLAYSNRVEYLGTPGTKNCSLKISDVRESDSGTYVFYIITNHPTQKMPEQSGVQLLVAGITQLTIHFKFIIS